MLDSFIAATTFFCALVYLISKPSTAEAETQTCYELNWDYRPIDYITAQEQQGEPTRRQRRRPHRDWTTRHRDRAV
jgi:hypothetical protein